MSDLPAGAAKVPDLPSPAGGDLQAEMTARLEQVIAPWGDRILDDDGWMEALATECVRQIRWAETRHCFGHGGPPPYLVAKIAPPEWMAPAYETYDPGGGS